MDILDAEKWPRDRAEIHAKIHNRIHQRRPNFHDRICKLADRQMRKSKKSRLYGLLY